MMTRRHALKTAALVSVACAAGSTFPTVNAQPATTSSPPGGPFTLPPLPYSFDALEPHIDAETMQIHHDKHHAAYVANLNKAIAEFPDLGKKPVEDLLKDLTAVPEKIRTAVRNQGGGHYNHTLFWQMMKKDGGGAPKGELVVNLPGNCQKRSIKNSVALTHSKTNSRKLRLANLAVAGHGWFRTGAI